MLRAMGAVRGAECFSDSAGAAVYAEAYGSGYAGHFVNGSGVLIERGSSFPVLVALNNDTSYWGDVARFASQSGVDDGTWTLYSGCYEGNAARFAKSTDDSQYSTVVLGANVSSEGLYIQGTLVHTALSARALPTSRGTEAVFGVTAPEVEVMASGSGRLSGGAARVEFDRLFAESISGPEDLRVTATPVGAWSALYLAQADASGFTVLSDGGDKGVAFNWVAVGRAKQYRDRPDVSIPDPAEDARVAAEKKAIIEAARPPARAAGPGVATLTAGE